MLFSAGTFSILLYCIFLSWYSYWPQGELNITPQELETLFHANSDPDWPSLFRSPSDLVSFLAEPGEYSHPCHLLFLLNLRSASFYEDEKGLRHILSRGDVALSLGRYFLPGLLSRAAFPLLAADLASYTLLQTHADSFTHTPSQSTTSPSSEATPDPLGYNTLVLVRFRSRRELVDWLLGVREDWRSGRLQRSLDFPVRAYQSLLSPPRSADSGGDLSRAAAQSAALAVPLSAACSRLLDGMVSLVVVPAVLTATYVLIRSFCS